MNPISQTKEASAMQKKIIGLGLLWVGFAMTVHAADMDVRLTTTDGSTKMSIQNASSVEVSSVTSLGDGYFRNMHVRSVQINNNVIISSSGHFIGTGGTPSINATASIGTVNSSITGTDAAGEITIAPTGILTVGGLVATVTFRSPYATAPYILISPSNSSAAALVNLLTPLTFAVDSTTTQFTITAVGLGVLSLGTTYTWHYHVIQ